LHYPWIELVRNTDLWKIGKKIGKKIGSFPIFKLDFSVKHDFYRFLKTLLR
jgi:hypothetical protein